MLAVKKPSCHQLAPGYGTPVRRFVELSRQPLGSAPLLAALARDQRGGALLQDVALDLTHVVARQGIDEMDKGVWYTLELAAERGREPGLIDRSSRLDRHMDFLLRSLVLHREHAHAADPELVLQRLFDRPRGDFAAEDVDDIGHPAVQGQAAIRAEHAEIAGVEVAVAEKGARCRLVVEIAGHAGEDRNPNEPDLTGRKRSTLLIDGFDPTSRDGTV